MSDLTLRERIELTCAALVALIIVSVVLTTLAVALVHIAESLLSDGVQVTISEGGNDHG